MPPITLTRKSQNLLSSIRNRRDLPNQREYDECYKEILSKEGALTSSEKNCWQQHKKETENFKRLRHDEQNLLIEITKTPNCLSTKHEHLLYKLGQAKRNLSPHHQKAIETVQKKQSEYKVFFASLPPKVRNTIEKCERNQSLNETETLVLAQHVTGKIDKLPNNLVEPIKKAVNQLPPSVSATKKDFHVSSSAQNKSCILVDPKLLQLTVQICEQVIREVQKAKFHVPEAYEAGKISSFNHHEREAFLKKNYEKLAKRKQNSQFGEVRYKYTPFGTHEGVDYSMHDHESGIIIYPYYRKGAIVIEIHEGQSNPDNNYIQIAEIADDTNEDGIYITTYRHMRQVSNRIIVGTWLKGGEALGDYRKIVTAVTNNDAEITTEKKGSLQNIKIYKKSKHLLYVKKGQVRTQANVKNGFSNDFHFQVRWDKDKYVIYNEHLHIEKRYLKGEKAAEFLQDGKIDKREGLDLVSAARKAKEHKNAAI